MERWITNMFHTILNTRLRNLVLAGGAMASMAAMPTAALAHHHGFHVDIVLPGSEIVVPAPQCDVAPAVSQVWVPAVYRTVTDRIWVEPVTTTQVQRVEVAAQYGWRDVIFYDYYGHPHVRRDQVQVSPAHCEDRAVQVVVCPGHFDEQTHQQLVCEGHWEMQQPVTVIQPPVARVEIPLPF
jgi:hypothetical protein